MVIEYIVLKKFRNYTHVTIPLDPKLNIFVGNNGQGKTNLIESIYFLTHLKSFRTSNHRNLLSFSEEFAHLRASFSKQKVTNELEVTLSTQGKQVFINQKKVERISDYIRNYFSLLFAPDQLTSFKEYPAEKRAFFDRVLVLFENDYLTKIKDFSKIQKSKNRLLKKGAWTEVKAWNLLLAQVIPDIFYARKDFVDELNQILSKLFQEITGREDKLTLEYKSDFETLERVTESSILEFISSKAEREKQTGRMVCGPQKDLFWMALDGRGDRETFSQGEYRISYLTLKLAVNQLIINKLGFSPVLLLDDIFSELDSEVSNRLIDYLSHLSNQVFISVTELPEKYKELSRQFKVKDGQVTAF